MRMDIPQLMVYNKIDLTDEPSGVRRDEYGKISSVFLSAHTGAGIEDLRLALCEGKDAKLAFEQIENQIKQERNQPWE